MNKRKQIKIANAARRGARWLDKNVPGWSRKVRRRQLDLNSTQFCILGQIDGAENNHAFDRQVHFLGLSDDECDRLGFSVTVDLAIEEEDAYGVLTEAWRDELKTRPR